MTRREAMATGLGALLGTFIIPAPRRIDLARFCARTPGGRFDLTTPYHLDDWTYATDSAVCVRVPPLGADKAEHVGRVPPFAGLSWNHDRLRHWTPMPDLAAIRAADSDCPTCEGYGCLGGVGQECEACQGVGQVFLSPYNTTPTDCDPCQGRGWMPNGPLCPACNGHALGVHPSIVRTELGYYYDAGLYRKVLSLPGVEVTPDFWSGIKAFPLLKFRFDGGDGMLMGLDQIRAEQRIREVAG